MTLKKKRNIIISLLVIFASILSGLTIFEIVKPKEKYGFVVSSSSSISSLNYTKESTGSSVYSSSVEGLIVPSPMGVEEDKSDSLSTIIGTKKVSIQGSKINQNTFDGFEEKPSSIYGIRDYEAFTYGMADSINFSSINDDPRTLGQIWKFHIRNNAYWENGDRVSADDFIQTFKYAINLKNGSTIIRSFRDSVPLVGVNDLIKEQEKYFNDHKKFRDKLSDYVNYNKVFSTGGGVWSQSDPSDENSSFYAYEGAENKSSSYLYYQLENGKNSTSFYNLLGNQLFLPINRKFVENIGGIDKFGLSKNTFLNNGPFRIDYYDPDYEIILRKSNSYWDKERTISKSWVFRIVPNIASNIQLFREGDLGQVMVPPDYLKTFKESKELNTFLTYGGTASSTTYIKWNLSTKKETGPVNEVVRDPYLRRAISYSLNRKDIIDIKGVGSSTGAGGVFTSPLYSYEDENGNKFSDYLYKTKYKSPSGKEYDSMLQFNPQESQKFRKHEYIKNIYKDSYHDEEDAIWNLNKFLERNPEYKTKKIPLSMIFSTGDQYTALMINQEIKSFFGDKIDLKIKPVPISVFDLKTSQNKDYDFAITYQAPDYQTDAWTFLRMLSGEPDSKLKTTSTINATGNWTYLKGLEWIKENEPSRLKMFNNWDGKGSDYNSFEKLVREIANSKNFSTFGKTLISEKGFSISEQMQFYVKLEILIRDQAPVIPIYHAASGWFARRIIGATALAGFPVQYKYAYNANNVPSTKYSLPGIEALQKSD
ncbi:MAG: hypothetical protein HRT99_01460 [Mycoplasmatales bacterium]|nr:hypothetical protein [Mycoplasmatales bacterium]